MTATIEPPAAQDFSYRGRIEALRQTKSAHTAEKIRRRGFMDIDDHGWVPWPDPIPFERQSNHPGGGSYGARCIGENFRAWLEVHPVYIHPHSALAGAWVQLGPPGVGGWRPEDRPAHLTPLHQQYNIQFTGIGAMNHCGPDLRLGLDLGWDGLLGKIRHYRNLNQPQDPSFYDGEEALVLGVQTWVRRHVTKAREMAAAEEDPALRDNLLEIAAINHWLIDHPPRTLREACQFLAWFQSIDRMWFAGGALGQLDELLRPYYEADQAAGRGDDEQAIWCIASLFFNDTHYSQIGGPAPEGKDLSSPVSFLVLEAMHRLQIPINIALRVHDGLDPELLRRAVQYLFEDGTGCSYACAKGLDEGYARNGVPLQVARMRAKVGCNWTALPGIEYCLQDVTRMCLVAPFLHAFKETAAEEAPTMEKLWARYAHHLGVAVDTIKQGFDWHMEHHARNCPEIVLDLFMHGTIERGLDMAEGGVDIYRLTCDGVGLATVADSFAATEQRVVREQRLSWAELAGHLEHSFAGATPVLLMLRAIPRFGSGGSRADYWAKRVADLYSELVRLTPTAKGYTVIPGLFSHGIVAMLGKKLGATPNGRRAGDPISHSANPDPGFTADGGSAPTAKSNAVAAVQPRWGNTTPLQLDIDAHLSRELGGVEAIEALIKGHNDLSGTLININVISKEQILEAHADPSKYPDLVVRVTGYSAYFRSLSPEYRQQVVDRLLAES
ncbi:MAG: pyruvate-formate lyase [Candidatus Latescibacteria bacterium]|nr:pyruvate-formate lyase [Candidatus Latescibacterota bacterium]